MLALGVFALTQMNKIRVSGDNIAQNSVPSIKALNEFTQLTLRLRVLSYRLLTNREADTQQKPWICSSSATSRSAPHRLPMKNSSALLKNGPRMSSMCSCSISTASSKSG